MTTGKPAPTLRHLAAPEPLLSAADVATLCGVSRRTVYAWVSDGRGPTHLRMNGTIRFRSADVAAFMAANVHHADAK